MIHARFLLGSVSSCPNLYKKIYTALKPGGWFEIVDMEAGTFSDDGTVSEDSACNQWGRWLGEAFAKLGKPILPVDQYEPMLTDAGFVNVRSQIMKRPTNPWPRNLRMKDVGRVGPSKSHVWS